MKTAISEGKGDDPFKAGAISLGKMGDFSEHLEELRVSNSQDWLLARFSGQLLKRDAKCFCKFA